MMDASSFNSIRFGSEIAYAYSVYFLQDDRTMFKFGGASFACSNPLQS